MKTKFVKRCPLLIRGLGFLAMWGCLLAYPVPDVPQVFDGSGWSSEAQAADFVEAYEGEGTIDGLYDDKIVIGDSLYVLSGLVRYYTDHTMTETAGRYHFKEGTRVGFLVNREGKVEVLFLTK